MCGHSTTLFDPPEAKRIHSKRLPLGWDLIALFRVVFPWFVCIACTVVGSCVVGVFRRLLALFAFTGGVGCKKQQTVFWQANAKRCKGLCVLLGSLQMILGSVHF